MPALPRKSHSSLPDSSPTHLESEFQASLAPFKNRSTNFPLDPPPSRFVSTQSTLANQPALFLYPSARRSRTWTSTTFLATRISSRILPAGAMIRERGPTGMDSRGKNIGNLCFGREYRLGINDTNVSLVFHVSFFFFFLFPTYIYIYIHVHIYISVSVPSVLPLCPSLVNPSI